MDQFDFTYLIKCDKIYSTWGRLGFDRYVEIKIASRRYTLSTQLNITGKTEGYNGQLAFA